jgi:hypothetical protein
MCSKVRYDAEQYTVNNSYLRIIFLKAHLMCRMQITTGRAEFIF